MRPGRLLRMTFPPLFLSSGEYFIAALDRRRARLVNFLDASVLDVTRATFDAAGKAVIPARERGGRAELARRLRIAANGRRRLGLPCRPATVARVLALLET